MLFVDTPIIVAVISAAAAAVVAPAISSYLTKKKERECVTALGGIVGTDSTPDGNRRFAVSCNTLHLIASKDVITALHEFQDEIRDSNPNKSRVRHDELLSRLIWDIRADLRIPGTPAADEFVAGLWCSGTGKEAPTSGESQ